MKKTKLMIAFWDLDIGGIQTVIRDLVFYIDRTYPDVEITILIRNKTESRTIADIRRNTRATISWVRDTDGFSFFRHFSLSFFMLYMRLKPDVLLTFLRRLSVMSILVSRIFFWRKQRIVFNEGILTSKYNQYQRHPRLWKFLISRFYPFADCIIAPSAAIKHDLTSNFYLPSHRIIVGKNWTLLSKKRTTRKIYDLIYVGRFDKEKNPEGLIDLIQRLRKRIPHITLCLVGKGREETRLRALVAEKRLQKNIIFAGYHADVRPYLQKAKIFIMTTHNEGAPIAILEAGSQGLPCVVTRFTGSEEIVLHGKTGYVADSVSVMSRYVTTLLCNDSLRRLMGQRAIRYVHSHFGKENIQFFVDHLLGI
jgi:glycosyltransferase involved in cell wall biosynthesis